MFVTPSKLVLLTGVSLLGICVFIGLVILLLHLKEKVSEFQPIIRNTLLLLFLASIEVHQVLFNFSPEISCEMCSMFLIKFFFERRWELKKLAIKLTGKMCLDITWNYKYSVKRSETSVYSCDWIDKWSIAPPPIQTFAIKPFRCFEFPNDRTCFFSLEIMALREVTILDFLGASGDKKACFLFSSRERTKERSAKTHTNSILMPCDVHVSD